MNLYFAHTCKQWSQVLFPVQLMLFLPAETKSKIGPWVIYVPGPSNWRYSMLPLAKQQKKREVSDVRHPKVSLHNTEAINWWNEKVAQIGHLVKENIEEHLHRDPFYSTYHVYVPASTTKLPFLRKGLCMTFSSIVHILAGRLGDGKYTTICCWLNGWMNEWMKYCSHTPYY